MVKYHTAALSHDAIRSSLYRLIEKTSGCYVMIADVWEAYCIYQAWDVTDSAKIYKQGYAIGSDDVVTLVGDPIEVAPAFVKKGTVEVVASRVTEVSGDAAAVKLLADLRAANPLVAAIEPSGNSHLVVMDLTTIGRASQHEGETKYLLETAGLAAAAPTLITKPVHVARNYDRHVDANKKPVAIGSFIGSVSIANEDGSITLRTIASLWEADFPDEVAEIVANRSVMGGSYEITYDPQKATKDGNVIRMPVYAFTGGAILLKTAAAHPESQVLAAGQKSRAQLEPVTAAGQPEGTKTSTSQGGPRMPKHNGIPVEYEPAVDLIILQSTNKAVTDASTPLIAERDRLAPFEGQAKTQAERITALEAELVAAKNDGALAAAKVDTLTTELATATTELVTFREAKAVADHAALLDTKWAELKTEFGLDDSLRAERAPLLEKLVAGKELAVSEMKQLIAGGKIVPFAGAAAQVVPLFGGRGDGTDRSTTGDPAVLAKTLPGSVAGELKKVIYR